MGWCVSFGFRVVIPLVCVIFIPIAAIVRILVVFWGFICNCFNSFSTPEIHAKKVRIVQDQVFEWNRTGRKKKMCTARPNWATFNIRFPTYKATSTRIKIDLGDIVELDTVKQTVRLEPLMKIGRLSASLLKMGWIVPLLPELENLTVGGLIHGTGVETSGHKYGFFQHICVAFEIVVADGRVLNCSKEENSDLFYSIPWSHGTLGFMTSATLMIIPAKKYMKLEYIPCHSLEETMSVFASQTLRETGNEYVEGMMFSLDKGVVTVGNMASHAEPGKVNSIGRWYKPWFYKHVESFLKKNPTIEYMEYIPLRDYFHRHTVSGFWEVENGFPFGNNVIFRYVLGWILPAPYEFCKPLVPGWVFHMMEDVNMLQDFVVPLDTVKDFLIFSEREAEVYPVWMCPTKIFNLPGMCHPKTGNDEMYVDIGLYGPTRQKKFTLAKSQRAFEELCIQLGGFQFLYGEVLLTRTQFETMLDHSLYHKVRKELKCEDAFPEVYDKICGDTRL